MKKLGTILILLTTMLIPGQEARAQTSAPDKKVLIVYFSHSGNTREIANQIKEATGADIFEIVPVKAYPTKYNAVVDQAEKELKADYRPALKSDGPDLSSYDVIFVGSPNWWNTMAPPVMTYLSAHKFAGKIVILFITHGSGGMGKSVQDVKRLCPGAKVLDGRPFKGSEVKKAREDVRKWVQSLQLTAQAQETKK